MAVQCPRCKGWFNDNQSYQNHLPCERVYGGASDLKETQQEYAKEGTGRP